MRSRRASNQDAARAFRASSLASTAAVSIAAPPHAALDSAAPRASALTGINLAGHGRAGKRAACQAA